MGTPRVSHSPILDSSINAETDDRDVMDDIGIVSLVVEDTAGVVLEGWRNGNTTCNWTSLVDLLHHGLLTADLTVLVSMVDLVVILSPASFAWIVGAVFAHDLISALLAVVMSSCSVDGAGLIGDLVLVHPLEGVVGLTTVATVIAGAGDEDLRGDVDIWPAGIPLDLDPIGQGRCGGMSPA